MRKLLAGLFLSLFCVSAVFAASAVEAKIIMVDLSMPNSNLVEKAILEGCISRKWTPIRKSDGIIDATLETRGHVVVVRIRYSKNGYSIAYEDSKNMKYNKKNNRIHAKYGQWVNNLNKSIQSKLDFTQKN